MHRNSKQWKARESLEANSHTRHLRLHCLGEKKKKIPCYSRCGGHQGHDALVQRRGAGSHRGKGRRKGRQAGLGGRPLVSIYNLTASKLLWIPGDPISPIRSALPAPSHPRPPAPPPSCSGALLRTSEAPVKNHTPGCLPLRAVSVLPPAVSPGLLRPDHPLLTDAAPSPSPLSALRPTPGKASPGSPSITRLRRPPALAGLLFLKGAGAGLELEVETPGRCGLGPKSSI